VTPKRPSPGNLNAGCLISAVVGESWPIVVGGNEAVSSETESNAASTNVFDWALAKRCSSRGGALAGSPVTVTTVSGKAAKCRPSGAKPLLRVASPGAV